MNINLTLLAQAVMFALFIWFTAKLVWPHLMRAIEVRQKEISDGLAAAERGRHDLELSAKRSAETLREAKERAGGLVSEAEREARRIIDAAKEAAKQEAQKVYDGKLAELAQEVERARLALRERVANLAVAGAERILRREVNAAAHLDMLNQLKQGL